jgi:aromatic ring-opening dioxygenase catalytic subunit (LigB family)
VKADLSVADWVVDLLTQADIPVEKKDRGFDHGTFIPLKVAYPEAKIPVVQLSLQSNLALAEQIRLGGVLQPLRDQAVLLIGSGQITHCLREMRQSTPVPLFGFRSF